MFWSCRQNDLAKSDDMSECRINFIGLDSIEKELKKRFELLTKET